MTSRSKTLLLCEGAVAVALAVALSYLKIDVGAQGGSLNFAMVPIILFAVHAGGVGWGLLAGFVFGTLKYFIGEGFAINLGSFILDYSVAYAAVGLAGLLRRKEGNSPANYLLGALVGCIARFIIHFISGLTIYAEYFADTYLGVGGLSIFTYSALYNGFYMLFNTIAAVILCPLIGIALEKAKLQSK
jgi:thiamine transporter